MNSIAKIRKDRGLTQDQLAKLSGVSRQTIVTLENNGSHIVKSSTLLKLANALNTTMVDLLVPEPSNIVDDEQR